MTLDGRLDRAVTDLEALYYVTQGLAGDGGARIARIRRASPTLSRTYRQELLALIERDVKAVRDHYGAIAKNDMYRRIMAEGRAADGKGSFAYLSKLFVTQRLFTRYDRVFDRWPHIKSHAFVVFDPLVGWINQVFEIDGQLFHDAQFLLGKARMIQGDAKRQKELPLARQRVLHSLLRPVVTALFTFLEAYLNGIAFDCFQAHHDSLDKAGHDLLAEWNSDGERPKFVPFGQKVFKYPPTIARVAGRNIDLSDMQPAHRLARDSKELRDAITHPSSHFDPSSQTQKKMSLLAGLKLDHVEQLYNDTRDYVLFVEQGLGHDAQQSAPWLFDDRGFKSAKSEAI